ncbi:hypothetical protein C1X59_11820 [Pseudomonas sp. FW215-R2]|uniref:DUF4376 domain-containing protein n=1 Tax=unclassified Pseudomonas TaxID=196821 RepID=UPI000C887B4E|nr:MULTISPECIES: DUF4376 domain-containing protein [unclassified Pseudomonas]PMX01579.1 hypothetical protein C1X59_11820 [Pseudomonas sp. FW215-R2]PMX08023.1 hypothetical protein C1X60_18875 [Pseudomonas sp. FW215-L1]PMX20656.1 hypothetical protein C1X57_20770 [Pseudomonas sp. FW215-E1]PNA29093.1 hypothetical protein C1X58_15495 [Pseudomonas sp. FW215-R4]
MYRAYSNNGASLRFVEPDWVLSESEVLFDHEPTIQELEAAFGFDAAQVERSRLALLIAEERYRREGTGVVVDGLSIGTTRDSQALIAGTGLSAVLNPEYCCNFKTMTGFVEISATQIIAIATTVRAHVQACFDREKALLDSVSAGTYREKMLAEGWPDSLQADFAALK